MFLHFILIFGVIASYINNLKVFGFEFEVELDEAFVPCIGKEKLFFDTFMDITNAELFKVSEKSLMVNGTVIMLKELPKDKPVTIKAMCECKKRGIWQKVAFTYTVPDFCAVEFKATEFWYESIKHFKGDERICPPPKGMKFDANEILVNTRFDIPVRVEEGEYRCNLEISQRNKVEMCALLYGEVHEVL